jgi:RNA polymerase sigma-70 factor, ECF subfamily
MPELPREMHEEAFPQLVETHYAALYRFALSLARNASDAADLTQQTFFVWATKGQSLRDASKAKTWLFTTLYREFLRIRRRGGKMVALEDLSPAEQDPPAVETDTVSKMDAELVMESLKEVDEAFREPLTLFYLQDLSYLEIAEILSVPIGTVMSRLSRGKTQLRSILAHKAGGGKVVEFPRQGGNRP